jgi:hypothetical protein
VQVAIIEPVGDQESDLMFGTKEEGLADGDSEKSTGLMRDLGLLRTFGRSLRLSGRDFRGGAILEGVLGERCGNTRGMKTGSVDGMANGEPSGA